MNAPKPITDALIAAINAELARGFTQAHVAERIGMERTKLNKFLYGHATITVETADRIAAALGLEVKKRRNP